MENCLVTKLKARVSNDNLPKFNTLIIETNSVNNVSNAKRALTIATDDLITVRGYFVDNTNDIDIVDSLQEEQVKTITSADGNVTIYFANIKGVATISNKSSITDFLVEDNSDIKVCYIDINQFKGHTKLEQLWLRSSSSYGDISSLSENTNMTNLSVRQTSIAGDVQSLNKLTKLQNLILNRSAVEGDINGFADTTDIIHVDFGQTNLTGNIISVSKNTVMTQCLLQSSNITCDIESFVAALVSNNYSQTTEPIQLNQSFPNSKIIFNNIVLNHVRIWLGVPVSNSKIIVYGAPSGKVTNATDVYVKGATAEEIAVWQSQGKTVTDVVSGTVYPPSNT